MRGLIKNNFYASRSNGKVFSGVMLLFGIFVVAFDNEIPSLLMGYLFIGIIGFSINAIAVLGKESATKWGRYKLTAPVRRADIVTSHFICLLIWMSVGIVFAAVGVSLSVLLHGFPFDKGLDVLLLFVSGIGISLLMGAFFFPLFYIGGDERNEMILIISLLGAIGLLMGLISLVNVLFGSNQTTAQVLISSAVLFACSMLLFLLSIPITISIYEKKNY